MIIIHVSDHPHFRGNRYVSNGAFGVFNVGLRLKLVPLILGAVLFFVGWQEWRLGTKAKTQPQTISATDLGARRPGSNAHIILTNFAPSDGAYVYMGQKGGGGAVVGRWQKAWVPAVAQGMPIFGGPMGMPGGPVVGGDIRIIIKTTKAGDENELRNIVNQPTLQGLVVNEVERMSGQEKQLLTDSYPGVDFNRCWIVEVGRQPAGVSKVLLFMGGGGMMALAGAALMAAKS